MFESVSRWKERRPKQLQEEISNLNKRRVVQLKIPKTKKSLIHVLRENKMNELYENHVTCQ